MANLPENSTFDAGVYQLEVTDPVVGGANGVSNAPIKNLTNRSRWLKDWTAAHDGATGTVHGAATTTANGFMSAADKAKLNGIATGAQVNAITTVAGRTGDVVLSVGDVSGAAPLASPVLTGAPVATTAIQTDSSTRIATTAFVKGEFSNRPTPAQFDNSTALATTAFVQRSGGNFQQNVNITANTTLTAAQAGSNVCATGTGGYTITLPLASTVPAGGAFNVFATGNNITISRAGADLITVNAYTGSIPNLMLNSGDSVELVSTGGGWILVGGSAAAQFSSGFGCSKASNGYTKLPNGLILQWGIAAVPPSSSATVYFPVAFPNAAFVVTVGRLDPSVTASQYRWDVGYFASTTFLAVNTWPSNTISGAWLAIGY